MEIKEKIEEMMICCKKRISSKYEKWHKALESGYTQEANELYSNYAYERGYFMALDNIHDLIKSEDIR